MLYDLIKSDFGEKEDYNCSETVLYGANKAYKLNLDKEALKLSAGFGGGMGIESVCGALTASIMVLSSISTRDIGHKDERLKVLSKKLFEDFENEMGSIICKDLKEKHRKDDIGCKNIILEAARILDKIVGENI